MMIKEAVIGLFSQIDPVAADRYYMRFHGPDVVNVSGPWLRHYVSFRTYDPPADCIDRFGLKKGRYTELWYTDMEEYSTRPGMASFTDPPWGIEAEKRDTEQALLIVPAVPTEDFLGKEPKAESSIMRWVCAIRYPKEVSLEEGEEWYVNIHAPEVNNQPGLLRHISFRAIDGGGPPPGGPPPGDMPKVMKKSEPWIRVTELWYENMDAWRSAVLESSLNYTPPPWGGEYPFTEILSNFVYYRPDIDFLKGNYVMP